MRHIEGRPPGPLGYLLVEHRHTALRGRVTLTDAGRAVLARRQDRIAICGIDRGLAARTCRAGTDLEVGRLESAHHTRVDRPRVDGVPTTCFEGSTR
jgi:hypothetical protein